VATQARLRSQSGSAPPRPVKRLNLGRPGCGGAAAQQDTIGHGHQDGVGVRTLATMNQLDPRVVHARAVAAGVEPRVIYARLAAAQMDRTSDTGEVQAGEGTVGDVEDSSEEGKDDDGADERSADEAPQEPEDEDNRGGSGAREHGSDAEASASTEESSEDEGSLYTPCNGVTSNSVVYTIYVPHTSWVPYICYVNHTR